MSKSDPQLRVGAHVLVQLGSELVTDVEQAILECVKNAYDADSPGCLIEVETGEVVTLVEKGTYGRLARFIEPAKSVQASLHDAHGRELSLSASIADDKNVERHLKCTGRITIEDHGAGMDPEQLRSSWLVISQSNKRTEGVGPKPKTKGGRTPLGDKGVGRLGSMKLGDVLLVESATAPERPIHSAQFRWADCEVADTVDEIPVFLNRADNSEQFQGTKVSVLGLRDLAEWRRKDRIYDLARSLAALVSPFETKSTFPVKVSIDGTDLSLVRITNETLKQAIAEFHFKWTGADKKGLVAEARFKKRLFTSGRTKKAAERTELVFGADDGAKFAAFLPEHRRVKKVYESIEISVDGAPWFIELGDTLKWSQMTPSSGAPIEDPGPFTGSFYFFHLDSLDESDGSTAAGLGIDKNLIKSMSGISILRDGFRVRSQGDWLDISAAMTSGSTYNMRVDNTVGYFALSGEKNYKLVEKSDREGFVEDAAYRGFLEIARTCRKFANDALENVRRSLDDYARDHAVRDVKVAATAEGSMQVVENSLRSANEAKEAALSVAAQLQTEIANIENSSDDATLKKSASRALRVASSAVKAIEQVSQKLTLGTFPELDLRRIRQEFDDRNERALSLLESAAVGLSARGLVHEFRTHLTEIRQKTNALEKIAKRRNADPELLPNIRAVRASCNAIVSAAGLIDPMLPRTRAVKEEIDLRALIEEYLTTRQGSLEGAGIKTAISGGARTVRANRSRMIQVIDNLVRNSIYWLRRGETIGETNRAKKINFQLTEYGFVESDTGPGVDPRYEDTLFDMFVTGKPSRDGGQGLGLFIIKQLLQIDGCDIALLSDRNVDKRRYRFSVNLGPLVKA